MQKKPPSLQSIPRFQRKHLKFTIKEKEICKGLHLNISNKSSQEKAGDTLLSLNSERLLAVMSSDPNFWLMDTSSSTNYHKDTKMGVLEEAKQAWFCYIAIAFRNDKFEKFDSDHASFFASWVQSSQSLKVPLDMRVQVVLKYLSQNLTEDHTVTYLSKKVHLSPSRLAHLFKQQVGDSIIGTLMRMRLHHATELLQFTSLRINEIAESVGFSSPDYFTRTFKAFFGISPGKYRKKCHSTPLIEQGFMKELLI
jgi:AraC-like DNA-binding protein